MYRSKLGIALRTLCIAAVVVSMATVGMAPVEAAPQVASVVPDPAEWIVDGRTMLEVTLTFDVDVVIPVGAITVHTRTGGVLAGVVVTPTGTATSSVVVTFDVVDGDVMTLLAAVSIVDTAGAALDGDDDGASGIAAVFQYTALEGDVTRDGIVDGADLNAFVAALGSQGLAADLNNDGVVDSDDSAILTASFGNSVSETDGAAPMVTDVVPEFMADAGAMMHVTFDEVMNPDTVGRFSVYALSADGSLVLASGSPSTSDNLTFDFPFAELTCDRDFPVIVDRSVADASGEFLAAPALRVVASDDTAPPTITCPAELFINSTTVFEIAAADVLDDAPLQAWLSSATVSDGCSASDAITVTTSLDDPTDIPLGVNLVTFTAEDFAGNMSTCDGVLIVVPAVPLEGTPGAPGSPGVPGSGGAGGADGANGTAGLACWDLNENGIADPVEDVNGDSLVNVLDCEGDQGSQGTTGPQGDAGPPGEQGPPGEAPAGQPVPDGTGTGTRPGCGSFCGAMGMVNLLWMFAGLGALRINLRRRR